MATHIERTLIPEAGVSYSVNAESSSLYQHLELPVGPGEHVLVVTLRSASGKPLAPARDVQVTLRDPSGNEHTTWRPGRSEQAEVALIADPAPGTWILSIEAGQNCDLALDAATVKPGAFSMVMKYFGRLGCMACKTVPRAVVVAVLILLAKSLAAGAGAALLAQLDRALEWLRKLLEMTKEGFAKVLDWLKDRVFDPVDRIMEDLCRSAGICT